MPDFTYINASFVAFKCAIIDLHIDTVFSINSSALKVACGPPGIGAEKSRKF
jgi:hypothetical protein